MIWKLVLLWAVQAQVLDPREARYYAPDSWPIIVKRAQDMQGVPRVEDDHFPCTEWVQARRDHHWMVEQLCECGAKERLYQGDAYTGLQKIAHNNKVACESILDARKGFFYVTVKRAALAHARERLGKEVFENGVLP